MPEQRSKENPAPDHIGSGHGDRAAGTNGKFPDNFLPERRGRGVQSIRSGISIFIEVSYERKN